MHLLVYPLSLWSDHCWYQIVTKCRKCHYKTNFVWLQFIYPVTWHSLTNLTVPPSEARCTCAGVGAQDVFTWPLVQAWPWHTLIIIWGNPNAELEINLILYITYIDLYYFKNFILYYHYILYINIKAVKK